jgi:hypothetical protein
MQTVDKIAEKLGRKRLAELVGVGKAAVTNATTEGTFPASWYVIVSGECDRLGIECPKSAFSFKSPPLCW